MVDILTFDGFFGAKFDILKPRWLPTTRLCLADSRRRRISRSPEDVVFQRNRRRAAVADCDRESRKWAGKRALPGDTYRRGVQPNIRRERLNVAFRRQPVMQIVARRAPGSTRRTPSPGDPGRGGGEALAAEDVGEPGMGNTGRALGPRCSTRFCAPAAHDGLAIDSGRRCLNRPGDVILHHIAVSPGL